MLSPEHEQPSIPLTPLEELAFVYLTVGDVLRDRPLRIGPYRAPEPSWKAPKWQTRSYHVMAMGFPVVRSPKTFSIDTV